MDFRTFSDDAESTNGKSHGEQSMNMLSTIGGGGEALPEGEPLGLDGGEGKAKLSTSTLAIGVVVVLGAAALFGMKLTLGGSSTDEATQEAINKIEVFMVQMAEAEKAKAQGPLQSPTAESEKVFAELKQNPTDHQVPTEEVAKNPFELVGIVRLDPTKPNAGPNGPSAEEMLARDRRAAEGLKINTIMASGNSPMVFLNNEMYKVGDKIGSTIFTVHEIEPLSIVIKSSTSGNLLRLRYE